jgi:hypothetical protein
VNWFVLILYMLYMISLHKNSIKMRNLFTCKTFKLLRFSALFMSPSMIDVRKRDAKKIETCRNCNVLIVTIIMLFCNLFVSYIELCVSGAGYTW